MKDIESDIEKCLMFIGIAIRQKDKEMYRNYLEQLNDLAERYFGR